jgi:hypothetical protein
MASEYWDTSTVNSPFEVKDAATMLAEIEETLVRLRKEYGLPVIRILVHETVWRALKKQLPEVSGEPTLFGFGSFAGTEIRISEELGPGEWAPVYATRTTYTFKDWDGSERKISP